MNEQPRRYTLAIDDRALDDLSQRLARTRWARPGARFR